MMTDKDRECLTGYITRLRTLLGVMYDNGIRFNATDVAVKWDKLVDAHGLIDAIDSDWRYPKGR